MIENNDFVGKNIDHNMAAYVIFHQHTCTKRGRLGRVPLFFYFTKRGAGPRRIGNRLV